METCLTSRTSQERVPEIRKHALKVESEMRTMHRNDVVWSAKMKHLREESGLEVRETELTDDRIILMHANGVLQPIKRRQES